MGRRTELNGVIRLFHDIVVTLGRVRINRKHYNDYKIFKKELQETHPKISKEHTQEKIAYRIKKIITLKDELDNIDLEEIIQRISIGSK